MLNLEANDFLKVDEKSIISFTGKDIVAGSLGSKKNKISHPIPYGWTRIESDIPAGVYNFNYTLEDIVNAYSSKKWSYLIIHSIRIGKMGRLIIFFEEENDAILFKLSGGFEEIFESVISI